MPILRPTNLIPPRFATSDEDQRLIDDAAGTAAWKRWGTYVSTRSWGTVREDYSPNGDAWNYFPHDHARSRAYHWGEDGIAGWCDWDQLLCFAPAFWNGVDPILKERYFGLTNSEGNHGEDVKEYYYFLDNTPTHSYARCLYKYPQKPFPYDELVKVNRERQSQPESYEYELLDTGVFDEDRYFDIFVEYAKHAPNTTAVRIRAVNRGPEAATLHLLPTLWFRDVWSLEGLEGWPAGSETKIVSHGTEVHAKTLPRLAIHQQRARSVVLSAEHTELGNFFFHAPTPNELLFTENVTNTQRLYGRPNTVPYCKDAFNEFVVGGNRGAVNPAQRGTKAAPLYVQQIGARSEYVWDFVLSDTVLAEDFSVDAVIKQRLKECDAFYETVHAKKATTEERRVQRQAISSLLWSKQFYFLDVAKWYQGDPRQLQPDYLPKRKKFSTRNARWQDLNVQWVMSVPDNWEYPWFAAWDLCFHCVTLAIVDPDYAKEQLLLLTSEALIHRNGQIPAYEWEFSDLNPPVVAWATWKVYVLGGRYFKINDRDFLERMFQKLLLNFGWWVNREDRNDSNIFEGGFLGLDNVSVFDRSERLPGGGYLEQSDGTAWMGLFALNMMRIAFELALDDPVYEDLATKFFEHFMQLSDAINRSCGGDSSDGLPGLWDPQDDFYYDHLRYPDGRQTPLRVRSLVGLLPMIAAEILDQDDLDRLPMFKTRYEWFVKNRASLARHILTARNCKGHQRILLSIVGMKRLRKLLRRLLDENEFLSPYGFRSLSKYHEKNPFIMHANGETWGICYEPAEAKTKVKGGNSNWRGPIWFPACSLLVDSLLLYDRFIGGTIMFPYPAPDGDATSCEDIARDVADRLIGLFLPDPKTGQRPCFGGTNKMQSDPNWKDYLFFFEHFHGDNGAGLGAMHQTGWTSLVANIINNKYGHKF
jgi:hypothetical protein